MKEICIQEIDGISIGQAENAAGGTGVTVFVTKDPDGMRAGLDVRGGGPASRDSRLLDPLAAAQRIHAVVLGGGSAFGLDAAGGVMSCLEEHGIGFPVHITRVPLVAQSDIFDLTVGDPLARPTRELGRAAAEAALAGGNYRDGNYGAGCGATVGKYGGMDTCMKSGIGSYAVQLGELKLGAVVVVNALGDVYDWKTGRKVAGLLTPDRETFASSEELMYSTLQVLDNKFVELTKNDLPQNTTLAVILTNASFVKPQLCKIAGMAHDGMARAVRPVHSTADGDSVYAVSLGDLAADQDLVGSLAAEVLSEAILRAVESAESAYGYPALRDL